MPFNGSGVFQRVRNWVADAAAGIKIRADYHDAEDDGFAAGLTNCITKDGQTIITQNIPFNSKRATGLADPVNPQDAATKAYADTKEPSISTRLTPPGAVMDFGMATAPAGWLACDGQSVATATYPALFAAIGYTWGGSGANFNVPNLMSRFRRHRDNSTLSGAVGVTQGPVNLAHTHTGGGTSSTVSTDHTHTYSGTTASMNRSNPHSHGVSGGTYGGGGLYGNFGNFDGITAPVGGGAITINNTDINHEHTFSGTTSGISANHTHTYSFTTSGGSADSASETRPYSATVLTCIKT